MIVSDVNSHKVVGHFINASIACDRYVVGGHFNSNENFHVVCGHFLNARVASNRFQHIFSRSEWSFDSFPKFL